MDLDTLYSRQPYSSCSRSSSIPTVFTFIKSLHYYQLFRPNDERFIGLQNFRSLLLSDQQFWLSLRLTVIFTAAAVGS